MSKARKLNCMAVPSSLVGKHFTTAFRTLLNSHKLLCIAILRAGTNQGSPLPYLYTNPDQTTVIEAGDKLFVIGTHSRKQLDSINGMSGSVIGLKSQQDGSAEADDSSQIQATSSDSTTTVI
jgi:hypothetical protein